MTKKKMKPYHRITSPEEINICLHCELANCRHGSCDKVRGKQRKKEDEGK